MQKENYLKLGPLDYFGGVLLELAERGKNEFSIERVKWHRAFYDTIKENNLDLSYFKVSMRTHPYVHSLEEQVRNFLLTGNLSYIQSVHGPRFRIEDTESIKAYLESHTQPQKDKLKTIAKDICDRINSP